MIENLTSSAVFPEGNASLSFSFQPQTGLTAVVGGNGTGKSFLGVETPRWLLYGKAALRGDADDYKDASAEGTFIIRGARYTIGRGKKDWIKDDTGSMLAVGATGVTEKVIELMGYDLDVFDICNAALQGETQKLGAMRPAERKRMIDKVFNLTEVEKAEKDCRTEATGLRRDAEAMTKALIPPGERPLPPENYFPSKNLQATLAEERRILQRHGQLTAQLQPLVEPKQPAGTFDIAEIERMEAADRERLRIEARHDAILSQIKPICYSALQLQAARDLHAYKARGPKPTMTVDEINAERKRYQAWVSHHPGDLITCPKCAHEFRTTGEAPPRPDHDLATLDDEERAHRAWHGHDLDELEPNGPSLSISEIEQHEKQLRLTVELATLPPVPAVDYSRDISRMRKAEAEHNAFLAAQLRYERTQQANAELERQIAALGAVAPPEMIDKLHERLREAERYEESCKAYDERKATFDKLTADIGETLRMADEYRKGAEGLADARATLKAMIAPKISRIASNLINDMTLGKLKTITVDDDMEIKVDGLKLNKLSGAGKTVANIALRVAMGQALVAHSFPVFLADEIDGDMEEDRRQATLTALAALKKHLSQIILITHRDVAVADNVKVTG